MLAEATRNAKLATGQFTKESDIKLGKMKQANQGFFEIFDRDELSTSGTADLYKRIRVVISVDYSIH